MLAAVPGGANVLAWSGANMKPVDDAAVARALAASQLQDSSSFPPIDLTGMASNAGGRGGAQTATSAHDSNSEKLDWLRTMCSSDALRGKLAGNMALHMTAADRATVRQTHAEFGKLREGERLPDDKQRAIDQIAADVLRRHREASTSAHDSNSEKLDWLRAMCSSDALRDKLAGNMALQMTAADRATVRQTHAEFSKLGEGERLPDDKQR